MKISSHEMLISGWCFMPSLQPCVNSFLKKYCTYLAFLSSVWDIVCVMSTTVLIKKMDRAYQSPDKWKKKKRKKNRKKRKKVED